MITGDQIRAARAIARWSVHDLSKRARVPIEAIRRAERADGEAVITSAHELAIRECFASVGVIFTDGGEPGVKVRRRAVPDEGLRPSELTAENHG
jgi:hypothetical protein